MNIMMSVVQLLVVLQHSLLTSQTTYMGKPGLLISFSLDHVFDNVEAQQPSTAPRSPTAQTVSSRAGEPSGAWHRCRSPTSVCHSHISVHQVEEGLVDYVVQVVAVVLPSIRMHLHTLISFSGYLKSNMTMLRGP